MFTRSRLVRRTRLGVVLGALAAGAVLTSVGATDANAQGRMMRMGMNMGGMGERVGTGDVERYADILGLSRDQRDAITALHEAYAADYDKAEDERRKVMERARAEFEETRDPSVWSETLPAEMKKYAEKVKTLDTTLMQDIKTLLTSEQTGKWVIVERARRRDAALPGGMLSGESVDLGRHVADLKLTGAQPEALAQTIDRYESELDAALQQRETERTEIGKKLEEMGQSGGRGQGFDMQGFGKAMADLRKTGIKVRDINDRYATQIENALPEDKREAFSQKVRSEKFPQVYREPYAMKAAAAAEKFEGLSADTKASIAALKESYQRDLASANEKWARAISTEEKDGGGDLMAAGMQRWMGGGDETESPQQIARKERTDLDRATLEKLKNLLTPEQVEKLPERESDRGNMWGGPGGGNRPARNR